MKTAKNRHDLFLQRFKKETILRWMASLTVTVVTAATVVVVTSREKPIVRFTDVSAVGNQIVYHAEVLDPGQTLVTDSLVLDIRTSLEAYQIPISTGQISGTQAMRYLSSEYTLSIKGSQGFGQKTFATEKVTSNLELSGAITDYRLLSSIEGFNYEVDVLIYNKDQILQTMWLHYGYSESYMYEVSQEPYISYLEDIMITSEQVTIPLATIPTYSSAVYLYLQGSDGVTTYDLGSLIINNPLIVEPYLSISDLSFDYVDLFPSIFPYDIPNLSGKIEVYDGATLFKSIDVTFSSPHQNSGEEPVFEDTTVRVGPLQSNHDYRAILKVRYLDEASGNMMDKASEELLFTTAPFFQMMVQVMPMGPDFNVNVNVNDPDNVISSLQYTLYEITGPGQEAYLTSGSFNEPQPGPMRTYSTTITKSNPNPIRMEIYASKTIHSNYYYGLVSTQML